MDRSLDHVHLEMMHTQVTGEVARLMEGFYSNLEDGLFELAYRDADQSHQEACFNLMRELRFRRQLLMSTFAQRMNDAAPEWFEAETEQAASTELDRELDALAFSMSRKCSAHFSGLLANISKRAASMTNKPLDLANLPIGPYQVARHFVYSCQRIDFDTAAIEVMKELFLRFVLDRLGTAYGQFNQMLAAAEANNRIERDCVGV